MRSTRRTSTSSAICEHPVRPDLRAQRHSFDAGLTLTEDDLRVHVKATWRATKVPREVVFLEELPRNATGKVLKRELRLIER